ncbi:MAG TPA: PilT/PilU family type 4a pilus ATPase [Candidatus Eremiobacteraeota bacterium]|nr:MAG: Twitching mobility protein [bacterium ADurb.Bin363]HPZ07306.1 PilT/PilU family type 4a pilus ATPase [Candidatus Eremiobacteraeota bacterium]
MDFLKELKFFTDALELGASDLHVSAGEVPMMRIHGVLEKTEYSPLNPDEVDEIIKRLTTNFQKAQFYGEVPVELDFSVDVPGLSRFRANIFRQNKGNSLVIRVIPKRIPTLEELLLPAVIKDLAKKESGLVLVTGSSGSGKSTTLAAMIDLINKEKEYHIVTIEDPIEFLFESNNSLINQREVRLHSQSFGTAIMNSLREDANVLFIGEIRDRDTAEWTIKASTTGLLVFASLYTRNATETIEHFINFFPPDEHQNARIQLSDFLQGIVSQTLVPLKGKRGRIVATEVMLVNNVIRNIIRDNKMHMLYTTIQGSRKEGMWTLDQSLMELVEKGYISLPEAYKRAVDKSVFEIYEERYKYTSK